MNGIDKFYTDVKYELLKEIGGEENLEKTKEAHPKTLKFSLWLWLHPSAYKLIHWGIPTSFFLQALTAGLVCMVFKSNLAWWYSVINVVLGFVALYIQDKRWKFRRGMTLYETTLNKY